MSKKIFNDSQMEKVHGAGVGNYIEGTFKIVASAGLAALSVGSFVNMKKISDSSQKKQAGTFGGGALATSLYLALSGVNQILTERRISKLEKNTK